MIVHACYTLRLCRAVRGTSSLKLGLSTSSCCSIARHHASTMAWQPRSFDKCLNAPTEFNNSFTVVTYNFLAQKYIDAGAHHYCHPEHRTWQRRWQRLEKELQHYNADILCLQEVEEPVFYEQLTPLLAKQQMQGIYRPRQKDAYGPPEGVALFFRTSCFELVKSRKIRLGDYVTRLQRCTIRCQDQAQEKLPPQPSQEQIAQAQSNLSSCFADCAEEYERQVPKLRQQTLQQLRQSRQSAGY